MPPPEDQAGFVDPPWGHPVGAPSEPAVAGALEAPVAAPVEPPVAPPAVAATLHAPATGADPDGGGEWALLLARVQDWIGSGQLQDITRTALPSLRLLALLLAGVVILKLYGALLGAIESLPLLPGLLELAGLVWLGRFSAANLVRSGDRRQLVETVERRWQSFRGRG